MPVDFTQPGATVQSDVAEAAAVARLGTKAQQVTGSQSRYRREFYSTVVPDWDLTVDPSMVLAQSGSALTVNMGTTNGATTSLVGKSSFSPPFTAGFGFKLSQKIANNEVYLEMVAENPDGTLDETTVCAVRIAGTDSVTNTIFRSEVRNGGPARIQSANLAGAAAQTADTVYEIVIEVDEFWVHSKVADSNAGRTTSYPKNLVAPDPTRRYRPRLRLVNNGVPASATTVTFYMLTVSDFTEIQASIVGGSGSAAPGQAIPIQMVNTPGVTLGSTAIASSATVTGLTLAKVLAAATVNNTLVKSTAGRLYGFHLANTSAAWKYVKFFNKATAPVAGTDTPVLTVAIPPGGTVNLTETVPVTFATGIGYAITLNPADLDNTAVAANDVVGYVIYA